MTKCHVRVRWIMGVAILAGLGAIAAGCGAPRTAQNESGGVQAAAPRTGSVDVTAAKAMMADTAGALVLDVRNLDEWNDDLGHIEGARLIPLPELSHRMAEIAAWRDKPVIVVCRVGVRSAQAADLLAGSGFRRVYNLEGGMEAWRRAGS